MTTPAFAHARAGKLEEKTDEYQYSINTFAHENGKLMFPTLSPFFPSPKFGRGDTAGGGEERV